MSDAATVKIPAEIKKLSFEKALAELEAIVGKLEGGNAELEESIEIYTRGTQLKAHCEAKLKDAEARVEKLVIGAGGDVSATPADID